MIKEAIRYLAVRKDLSAFQTEKAFSEIMRGAAEPSQIGAFITALRIKGETVTEIAAAAKVMRKFARAIDVRSEAGRSRKREPVLDTCGTGGSRTNAFNISTAAAFVIAGCGIKVAKHGNRSVSSACGSADVLEALGVNINITPARTAQCVRRAGIGFMYAPLFHGAMKHAAPVRKAIGIRTIFNILGPLSNPAEANCQLLGVYDKPLTIVIARVLKKLRVRRAFVVHGLDGLDEISITSATQVSEVSGNTVKTYTIRPGQFGFKKARPGDIAGSNAKNNAKTMLAVLKGVKSAKRDAVLINAAYGLLAAKKAVNVKEALKMARYSIDSGSALNKLNQLKVFSNR